MITSSFISITSFFSNFHGGLIFFFSFPFSSSSNLCARNILVTFLFRLQFLPLSNFSSFPSLSFLLIFLVFVFLWVLPFVASLSSSSPSVPFITHNARPYISSPSSSPLSQFLLFFSLIIKLCRRYSESWLGYPLSLFILRSVLLPFLLLSSFFSIPFSFLLYYTSSFSL